MTAPTVDGSTALDAYELAELRLLTVLTERAAFYVPRVFGPMYALRRLVTRGLAERAPFSPDDDLYKRRMFRPTPAGLWVVDERRGR